MRRLITFAIAAAVFFGSVAAARAGGPVVELMTTSDAVSTANLQAALPAFQQAVDQELGPVWNVGATLVVGDAAHPQPADMTVMVTDAVDCFGCLGYHWLNQGKPYAKVFPDADEAWPLILSHELFEMLVDPYGNRYAQLHGRVWLVEVADQVESGFFAHFIDGVAISDFVTPAWFQAGSKGPYDFANMLDRPGQIGRHGYASYRKPFGGWGQVFG